MTQERLERHFLQATLTGKRPRGRPRTNGRDCISDLALSRLGVESAERSVIAENREVFQVLVRLLLPGPYPGEKQA